MMGTGVRSRMSVRHFSLAFVIGLALLFVLPAPGTFAIEMNDEIGGHRLIDLTATVSFHDGLDNQTIEKTAHITVKRVAGVDVGRHEDYDWRHVYPEKSVEFEASITNTGNDLDHFVLDIIGLQDGWTAEILHAGNPLLDGNVTLGMGEKQDVIVRVTAPARHDGDHGVVDGDEMIFRLQATSVAAQQAWYEGPTEYSVASSGDMPVRVVDAEIVFETGEPITSDPSDHQNDVSVTYNAKVTNEGTGPATEIEWVHPVPGALDLDHNSIRVDGGVGCGAVVEDGNIVVRCDSIGAGETIELTFEAKVPAQSEPGSLSADDMSLDYKDSAGSEKDQSAPIQVLTINEFYSLSIHVKGILLNDGDLITDFAVTRGDKVTIRVEVRNEGNMADSYSIGHTNAREDVSWQPETRKPKNVGPGGYERVDFFTTLSAEFEDGDTESVTFTAESEGDSGATAQISAMLTVYIPVIDVSLTANEKNPLPGEEVELTLTIENVGGHAAKDLHVDVPIPGGTTYLADSLDIDLAGWNGDDTSGNLTVGPATLEAQETLTIRYTVVID